MIEQILLCVINPEGIQKLREAKVESVVYKLGDIRFISVEAFCNVLEAQAGLQEQLLVYHKVLETCKEAVIPGTCNRRKQLFLDRIDFRRRKGVQLEGFANLFPEPQESVLLGLFQEFFHHHFNDGALDGRIVVVKHYMPGLYQGYLLLFPVKGTESKDEIAYRNKNGLCYGNPGMRLKDIFENDHFGKHKQPGDNHVEELQFNHFDRLSVAEETNQMGNADFMLEKIYQEVHKGYSQFHANRYPERH